MPTAATIVSTIVITAALLATIATLAAPFLLYHDANKPPPKKGPKK